MKTPRTGLHGFTLIELLVVISIIALLIAILLPALAASRDQAKRAICGSNARQLAIIWTSYAADSDGFYPFRDSNGPFYIKRGAPVAWDARLLVAPYTASLQVFYCPNTGNTPDTPGRWNIPSSGGNVLIDYSIMAAWKRMSGGTNMVTYVGPETETKLVVRAEEARPAMVMLADQAWTTTGLNEPNWFNHPKSEGTLPFGAWQGLNVTRYDGSTGWRQPVDTTFQAAYATTAVKVFY